MSNDLKLLSLSSELIDRARAYAADDPDVASTAWTTDLIARALAGDADAAFDLDARFARTLEFGTAGLRGPIGPGTACMNRVVVMRAAWGVGRAVLAREPATGEPDGVVIGFDSRRMSRQFAEDSASVLAGLGLKVWIFDEVVPTPLCAFAVRHLGAAAGIMVTASHNPPEDNGFKVYHSTGGQIIPPQDGEVSSWIARAPTIPSMRRPSPYAASQAGLRIAVPASVDTAWHDAMVACSMHPGVAATVQLPIVYTAMHGVGAKHVLRAMRNAGFEGIAQVSAQTEPDGAFPTVAFPNPEEKGAMDLAFALATEVGAKLVLANDPDADRLAVAVPGRDGGWRQLSGNEVGWLLGADALENFDTGGERRLVVTTIVSSSLLGRMAAANGADYAEVLTGFKWLAQAGIEAKAAGRSRFVFGYEEAIGYEIGGVVRDKDGVHAAVRVAELTADLASRGQTLLDRLDELALRYGLPSGDQWSARMSGNDGLAKIAATMAKLRAEPLQMLAGSPVVMRRDLNDDTVWSADGSAKPLGMPSADVLIYEDADGTRLIVRPSGTEPKVKFYVETMSKVRSMAELDTARAASKERISALRLALNDELGLA